MIEDRFVIDLALRHLQSLLAIALDITNPGVEPEWLEMDRRNRLSFARVNAELARRMNPLAHAGADHGHSPIAPLEMWT